MKYLTPIAVLLLTLASADYAKSAEESNASEVPNVFQSWLAEAFGVRVERDAAGKISATPSDDLPVLASQWYRRNGQPGQIPKSVPVKTIQEGDFLMISIDFSEVWPDVTKAKRYLVYFLDNEHPYVLVTDKIDAGAMAFWTMQLPLPKETVPFNWEINLADSDRRADLLATVDREFDAEIELNRPVGGYVKAKSGRNMLLARLLRTNEQPQKYADKMSPMNIRVQDGRKFLTTEVRADSPSIQFALVPHKQNRTETPSTILSSNSVWMEWLDFSHRYTFEPLPDGDLGLKLTTKAGSKLERLGFGVENKEPVRPTGELIAAYDFESLSDGLVKDNVGSFDAKVERGKPVDGLRGQSIYLGYPDKPERNHVKAGITIPETIREKLADGHISVSFWYKSPMGQTRNRPDSFAWPMADAMRNRQYLNTGLFGVGHTHWQLNPITRGFNAASQERAESGPLVPGKWNHLVFTSELLDPEKRLHRYEVYVNGVVRTSREMEPLTDLSRSKLLHEIAGPIMVGNVWGTIDNLAIYNYPLGEDEILDLFSEQLQKQVSYYSSDQLVDGNRVASEPPGNYPEDQILDNHWVPERDFSGLAEGAKIVPGVKGNAIELETGIAIPEKAMWDLSQGAFTIAFYFKYTDKGMSIINSKGMRLDINQNKFHGAVGNDWENKYLGFKEGNVEPDVWNHLALSYDRRDMKMYLNGELLYSRPMVSREGINFTDTINVGGKGTIDEIYFFNYAIDSAQVKELAKLLPKK